MLMPLEAEGRTGFRIQDSGFRKGKNRIQDSGVRSRNEGHLLFADCLLLSALRFLPSAYCRLPTAFRIRDWGRGRTGVRIQDSGFRA